MARKGIGRSGDATHTGSGRSDNPELKNCGFTTFGISFPFLQRLPLKTPSLVTEAIRRLDAELGDRESVIVRCSGTETKP